MQDEFPEAKDGLIVCLKNRFSNVITTDEHFDPKYLVASALDPVTASYLDFNGHQLAGFVLEMVNFKKLKITLCF